MYETKQLPVVLHQNAQWMVQNWRSETYLVARHNREHPDMPDEERLEGKYWISARDIKHAHDDLSIIRHVCRKMWVDIALFEDVVRKAVEIDKMELYGDLDTEFSIARRERAEDESRPSIMDLKEADADEDPASIDDGNDTSVIISCHRETSRLRRVLRVYERALNSAHGLGEIKHFRAGLKKLHDHKGQLTAVWRSVSSCMALKIHVEAAWEGENEWEVVHEDEAGKIIAQKLS